MGKYLPWMVWSYRYVEPYSLALMRFFCGSAFFIHGSARLFTDNRTFGLNSAVDWLTPSGVGLSELVCGALLAFGLLTRPAALAMTALWFLFAIGATPNGKQHWLMLGAFDHYPAMLMLLSIGFLMRGGGRYSLDRLIGREF
jgi:putative oxidoreductase